MAFKVAVFFSTAWYKDKEEEEEEEDMRKAK